MDANQAKHHLRTLGILHIVLGILGIVIALFVYMAITMGGMLSGDMEAITITQIIGIAIGVFITLFSLPGIIGGWGIMRHKFWAKIVLLIVALLDLLNFPLGTALAVYTFWVLLQPEVDKVIQEGG